MKENNFNEKSFSKSLQNRTLIRAHLFDRNRQIETRSYLESYSIEVKEIIMKSIEGPIPAELPPSSQAVRSTISYYRRQNLPVFKTRQYGSVELDPHMVYESLWSLSFIDSFCPPEVIVEFETDLLSYLQMPYQEIRCLAVKAAGQNILGKPEQIEEMMRLDKKNVWVMIKHVNERKIDSRLMLEYFEKDGISIFEAIYKLTNTYKEDIIYPLLSSSEILPVIIFNFGSQNYLLQDFSIRIIGKILAEIEDYAGVLTRYNLLDHTIPLLMNQKEEIKRNGCWLLANYAFSEGGANEILKKSTLMERLMIIFRKEKTIDLRVEVYYILSHLALYGNRENVYNWSLQSNLLEVCTEDLEISNQNLVFLTLNLIQKLIDIGDEFLDIDEDTANPFSYYIASTNLKTLISQASFSQNQEISLLSLAILDKIYANGTGLGMQI